MYVDLLHFVHKYFMFFWVMHLISWQKEKRPWVLAHEKMWKFHLLLCDLARDWKTVSQPLTFNGVTAKCWFLGFIFLRPWPCTITISMSIDIYQMLNYYFDTFFTVRERREEKKKNTLKDDPVFLTLLQMSRSKLRNK